MKKIIFIISAIIIGVGVYFVFFHKTVEAPHVEEIKKDEINILTVTDSKKQVIKEGYEIDFKFPVTGNKKIDSEIMKNVDQLVSTFETEAESFLIEPLMSDRKYSMIGNYESHLGLKYDTFVFLVSIDFGGAHPNHFYRTITFDKGGNVLSLQDVLNKELGTINVLDKISELTRKKITEKLGENTNIEMLKAGTRPDFENFKNFYIKENQLVFLFEPYAVAPYAYSTQEASIDFNDLKI
jgi:hypothetical protein